MEKSCQVKVSEIILSKAESTGNKYLTIVKLKHYD